MTAFIAFVIGANVGFLIGCFWAARRCEEGAT